MTGGAGVEEGTGVAGAASSGPGVAGGGGVMGTRGPGVPGGVAAEGETEGLGDAAGVTLVTVVLIALMECTPKACIQKTHNSFVKPFASMKPSSDEG